VDGVERANGDAVSGKRNRPRRPSPGGRSHRRGLRVVRSPAAELAGLRGEFLAWLVTHGLPSQVDTDALWADTLATVGLATEQAG
jgi:hypothetical protein